MGCHSGGRNSSPRQESRRLIGSESIGLGGVMPFVKPALLRIKCRLHTIEENSSTNTQRSLRRLADSPRQATCVSDLVRILSFRVITRLTRTAGSQHSSKNSSTIAEAAVRTTMWPACARSTGVAIELRATSLGLWCETVLSISSSRVVSTRLGKPMPQDAGNTNCAYSFPKTSEQFT